MIEKTKKNYTSLLGKKDYRLSSPINTELIHD